MTASHSDALVLFGVTGDLAHKMIFPALYALAKRGALNVPVIGVASPNWSLADLLNRVKDSMVRSGEIHDQRDLDHLMSLLSYQNRGIGTARRGRRYPVGEDRDLAGAPPGTDEQLYTADANIVDLGLVYDVRWRHATAHVVMTMPHRGRAIHDFFVTRGGGRVDSGIRERLLAIDGVRDVVFDLTWEPPWTPARLTETGRRSLGLDAS